ncbi:MAG: DegV family protein [Chloroflexi bacterium]|nr:DegV family protein [Chloroflexota bacterium]
MIKIVVGSTTDLPQEWFQRYQITSVPLNIHFGTETFKENIDLDQASFYRKVEMSHMIPKTSQPSPGEFMEAFRRAAGPGDAVLSILISSKLSGTYQSAELAASQLAGELPVYVFDSLCGSAGEGFMALEAARMAEAGGSIQAILKRLEEIRARMNIFLTPETLKYLQMSGRVTNAQALIGSVLSLKPVIALNNGALAPAARIRTRSKALDHLLTMTEGAVGDKPINLAVIHAQASADAEALMARARQMFKIQEGFVQEMSTVIAAHLGPGCLGLVSYVV